MTKSRVSVKRFETLGRQAYLDGKGPYPLGDPTVYAAIENLKVGEGSARIMKAWNKGWNDANLADESWKS